MNSLSYLGMLPLAMVSGIDLMPTFLDALNLPAPDGLQGCSLRKMLLGKNQPGRNFVYAEFAMTFAGDSFRMRAIQSRKYAYIVNYWPDEKTTLTNESKSGLSYRAISGEVRKFRKVLARYIQRTGDLLADSLNQKLSPKSVLYSNFSLVSILTNDN